MAAAAHDGIGFAKQSDPLKSVDQGSGAVQLEDEHNSDGDDNFSDGSDEEMAEPEAGEIAETLARLGSPVENRNKGGKVLKRANHHFMMQRSRQNTGKEMQFK